MKKQLTFLMIAIAIMLPGCRNKHTSSQKVAKNNVAMPMGTSVAQTKFFDEDIEAFILEEDATDPLSTTNEIQLAYSDIELDFDWSEPDGVQQTLQTVYFNYDSAAIRPDQQEALQLDIAKAQEIVAQGNVVAIKGHACKWHGTREYNIAISERRAQTIATAFKQAGIPSEKLKVFGVGQEEPIVHEMVKAAQAPNRRVEVAEIRA